MIDEITLVVGEQVTIGLGSHDIEAKAWVVFPEIGKTHEQEPYCSPTATTYREIKTTTKFFEAIVLPCIKKANHLKGKLMELQETEQGNVMALVDLGKRQRWFANHLLNCPPLSATGPQPT